MFSRSKLERIRKDELKKLCDEKGLNAEGMKQDLIERLLEGNECTDDISTNQQSTDSMLGMMSKMMEMMVCQQAEDRKVLLELVKSQGSVAESSLAAVRKTESLESLGTDPKAIMDQFRWLLKDLGTRLDQLQKEMTQKVYTLSLKDSVHSLQRAEEKLIHLVSEKLSLIDNDCQKEIEAEFAVIQDAIFKSKTDALRLCHQEEEAKKAGGLPHGILPPNFYGDCNKYPVWWESFNAIVNENEKVSKFYKYRYLRQVMKGDAEQCLDGFSPLAENYELALEHVRNRYGQPRKVVRHIMKSIVEIPPLASDDQKLLRKYFDTIVGKIHDLERYAAELENPIDAILIPLLESKLPKGLRQNWEKEMIEKFNDDEFATLGRYTEWCLRELRARETVSETEKEKTNTQKGSTPGKSSPGLYSSQALPSTTKNYTGAKTFSCLLCDKGHKLEHCFEFKKREVAARWEFAKSHSLCYSCLDKYHPGSPCSAFRTCNVENCSRSHHPLLHLNSRDVEIDSTPNTDATGSVAGNCSAIKCLSSSKDESIKIMPSAVAVMTDGAKSQKVRIAFDTMCQDSFISEKVVKTLGLKYEKTVNLEVTGFGGERSALNTGRVHFSLVPLGEKTMFPIDALVKKGQICTALEPVDVDFDSCPHLKGLHIADRFPRLETEVDILIGLNHYLKLVSGEIIRHPEESQSNQFPAAMKTVFGFVIFGPNASNTLPKKNTCLFTNVKVRSELEMDLDRFWSLESIGLVDKSTVYTADEQEALQCFHENIQYTGERYQICLPFKKDAPTLQNNYTSAKYYLKSIEKRMKSSEELENYERCIKDYVDSGFAREASPLEIEQFAKSQQYFVPHHPVFKKESVSTKTRVVFNASSSDPNGISLNDCLLPGPALQPNLVKVLLNFRTKPVALIADIQKMFCQTEVHPKNYPFQQFLWRHFDRSVPPTVYIMTRLMFGVKPSPFLSMKSIKHHISKSDMQKRFPRACAEAENLYVDDLCTGGSTDPEVIELIPQLIELFRLGGWKLTKFLSNSEAVMKSIPVEDRLSSLMIPFEENELGYTKALGIGWDVENDCFRFQLNEKHLHPLPVVTKRTILSKVFQVFDVFGFYSPFVIRMKVLIQELWKLKVAWDEQLSDKIAMEYYHWEVELKDIGSIEIPRAVIKEHLVDVQLHAFGDASEKAYGVVLYVRTVDEFGMITVRFLIAKSRVAPLKFITLPRLELLSGHAASKLMNFALNSLDIKINMIRFWLDSEIALCWISKSSNNWKTFISNRVQEIHDCHDRGLWGHVQGSENPADMITRGMTMGELQKSKLYWNGPEWLSLPEEKWPNSTCLPHDHEDICMKEVRVNTKVLVHKVEDFPLLHRYERYSKLLRVVAQILKVTNTVPKTANGELDAEDLQIAEFCLIRRSQKMHFSEEFEHLSSGRHVPHTSQLLSLDPFYDCKRQLIVVGGRLKRSSLPEETKHQIILPCKDLLVEMLIMYYHEKGNHAPIETTICTLRQKYWIIKCRREVKKVIHKCLICKHHHTKSLEPKMGDLPAHRIQIAPAFSHIGLDFTGPIYIKEALKKSRKAYICLFTCANSRMVHLELTLSMTTEEFIGALRRMMNRRGICQSITSDNQTSFKKASRIIQNINSSLKGIAEFDPNKFEHFCADNDIKWMFITERSPFRGGYWERLNRSLKGPLKKVLGKALLTYPEMYTVLTDIEAAINQRPLTYQGTDPDDLQALTPAHLAIGRPLGNLPHISYSTAKLSERFGYIQDILQHFWNRWTREYLPCLQLRTKWKQGEPQLNINDVVLISEDNSRRNTWPMGRVVEVVKGKDGISRTARIRTVKGEVWRPFQKLHLFEKYEPTLMDHSESLTLESNDGVSTLPTIADVSNELLLSEPVSSQGAEDVTKPQMSSRYGRKYKRPKLYGFN